MERLRRLRGGIDDKHHLTLMCSDLSELGNFARVDNRHQYRWIKARTPGPYVFILEGDQGSAAPAVAPGSARPSACACRTMSCALALLAELGQPMISATLQMPGDDEPMNDPAEIRARLEKQLDLVVDGGPAPAQPTTVIDLSGGRAGTGAAGPGRRGLLRAVRHALTIGHALTQTGQPAGAHCTDRIGHMDSSLIQTVAVYALPVLFAITLHEAAHGYVARFFGDDTAYRLGRVSLNPIRHIDPIGTVAVPLLLYFLTAGQFVFGFAKPVPVVFGHLRNPRWHGMWVALAGPGSNLAQAFIWALVVIGLAWAQVQEPFWGRWRAPG